MNKITLSFFLSKSKTTIKGLLALIVLLFMNTQTSWGQISITGTGSLNTYNQNFDSLANTGTSSVVPAGWVFEETGAGSDTNYEADNGSSSIGNTYSYGSIGDSERALGILRSSSVVVPAIGVSFTNNTGGFISQLVISYKGEQWRIGEGTGRSDKLVFYYSLDATSLSTGTWQDVFHLDFTSPIVTGTVGAIDGNAIGNNSTISYTLTDLAIAPGQTFWLRFNDNNNLTANDGLAIDDFSMYAAAPVSTTWDGLAWSNGAPSSTKFAIIAGSYSEAANFTAKSLAVNNSAIVTIPSGTNVTVTGPVIVTAPATFTLSNNANLIQVDNATNTGVITVNRKSSLLKRLDYTAWSSPVSGAQTLAGFSPLTSQAPSRFYFYDTNYNTGSVKGAYSVIANPATTNFNKGAGYLIRMPNTADAVTPTPYAGQFTGTPNNGNVAGFLVYSSPDQSYNLVGNPYPSVIDAETFIATNTSMIESVLYFWRKTNGASGSAYATYTAGGGTTITPTSESPNGKIQVGQGFLVQAKSQGYISGFFTNAMRDVSPTSTQVFKTKKVVQKDRVWLNLTNTTGAFSQALVAYIADATPGVDIYDGKYINDSPIALTSDINNEEYTIQGRPAFDASDVVALNFKTNVAGNYTIAIDHTDGLFTIGQDIYLVDSKTGAETNLKTEAYTFAAVSGVDNARFSLKYQKTLKVDAPSFNENSVAVYKNKSTLYVNSGAVAIANIKVFDIQGRLIAEQKNVKSNTATISNLKATQQVLIVKVTGQDNSVVSKKVLN
jgi:hypothetical protein